MHIVKKISDVNEQPLEDDRWYIYVVKNSPQGNIKIGRSRNPKSRFRALSGSNSGGNKLVLFAISDPTWVYFIERMAHEHFSWERIKDTEWFNGKKLEFLEVVDYIDSIFEHKCYEGVNKRIEKNLQLLNVNEKES